MLVDWSRLWTPKGKPPELENEGLITTAVPLGFTWGCLEKEVDPHRDSSVKNLQLYSVQEHFHSLLQNTGCVQTKLHQSYWIPKFPYQSTSGLEEQWAQGHVVTVLPWQTLRAAVTAASWKQSHMWQLVKTCGNLWSLHFHHLYDAKLAMVTHLIWENSKSNIKYIWKLKSYMC